MSFEIIKHNYDRKLWNIQMVATAVIKGIITEEQYYEITHQRYVPVK